MRRSGTLAPPSRENALYSRLVTDLAKDIPKRAAYKAAEVCEIARIQPYVLRSWESEFPKLGVMRGAGVARIYRRADVEQVLRIKQLVFDEGLTLAGARRRLEQDTEGQPELPLEEVTPAIRQGIERVKQGLHDLLDLLGNGESGGAGPVARDGPAEAMEQTANEPLGKSGAARRAPNRGAREPRKATRRGA